jgi:uncharacterized membrane protein
MQDMPADCDGQSRFVCSLRFSCAKVLCMLHNMRTQREDHMDRDELISAAQPGERKAARRDFNRTVGAIYYSEKDAERAVRDLLDHSFAPERIRTAMLSTKDTGVVAEDLDHSQPPPVDAGQQTKVAAGAAAGGAAGALAIAALAIPGIGSILMGAAAGGLLASLVDAGINENDAQRFEQGLRAGGVLVTVNAGARLSDAVESLIRSGGYVGDGSRHDNQKPALPGNERFQPG